MAEDNVINRQLILHILGNLGYEPDCVENGEEAVEAAGRADYDLILMDVQMPEMDGLEATEVDPAAGVPAAGDHCADGECDAGGPGTMSGGGDG